MPEHALTLGEAFSLHHAPDPGRVLPEKVEAITAGPWIVAPDRWLYELDSCEIELFDEQMEKYLRLKDRDPLTEDEGADFLAAMYLAHWLCRQGLQRLGELRCECEACTEVEAYFVPAVNKAMRSAGRVRIQKVETQAPELPQAQAVDGARTAPRANEIMFED